MWWNGIEARNQAIKPASTLCSAPICRNERTRKVTPSASTFRIFVRLAATQLSNLRRQTTSAGRRHNRQVAAVCAECGFQVNQTWAAHTLPFMYASLHHVTLAAPIWLAGAALRFGARAPRTGPLVSKPQTAGTIWRQHNQVIADSGGLFRIALGSAALLLRPPSAHLKIDPIAGIVAGSCRIRDNETV